MIIYIGELIGTFLFILVGLGVSANAYFYQDNKKLLRLFFTSLGWGLAYVIPSLAFGEVSGPHLNPGITIAFSLVGMFDRRFAIGYIISQTAGALIGCIVFYICYYKKINEIKDSELQLKIFCVCPEEKNVVLCFIKEIVASFVLMFGLMGISQVYGIRTEIVYIFYITVFTGVGMAFDFSDVACNPIRDLVPRIFHLVMPMKNKGKNHFFYVIITVIASIIGCVLAVYLIKILPWDSAVSHG